ncbi:MAG: ATP-binding cassette domain-containing protein, partial [Fimbriimonadaceae bacterium]|nr:ATP-binding cassette domain-containing protein [Alphaproteobacteria bacterium]
MFKVEGLRPVLFGPYDFSLAPGECLVVTGPSGSGKSLLLRALADLDPSTGTVSLDNIDRNSMPASRWRRKVRYVAAEPGWWRETATAHFDEPDAVKARLGEIGLE